MTPYRYRRAVLAGQTTAMVATHRNQELRLSFLDKVDAALFVFAGLATIWLGLSARP